jgi:hypothetical protein
VIVIVADSSAHAKSLREEFKLNWTSVIVDEFKTYSSKMCPDPNDTKSLSLPRSFVLNSTGQVKRIISEEADDYIDQLLGALYNDDTIQIRLRAWGRPPHGWLLLVSPPSR